MPGFGTMSEADALAFLANKGFTCVRLDDVRNDNDQGLEFSVMDIARPATWLAISICLFSLYRIALTLQKINKMHSVYSFIHSWRRVP